MLNLKKVIALVCAFAMMLTTVAFGATYTDVTEDSAYYEAVETLNKLDIVTGYEDGTYKPEDGVTRAEMAALIARIQGYGETAKGSANTGFTDVPASHWASGYIANAAGMGIINGYGDGTFGPEDPVLYEQAVKMIMATLGYTPFAEKNGGYPTGYLAAAQRYDVSLAVANAAVGQAANRGTVAQLLANAIDTPLMVQSKWNTNGEVEYVIADGKGDVDYKTLMSENLGYVKLKGIVVENTESAVDHTNISIDTTAKATVKIKVVDSYDTNNKTFLNYVDATTSSTGTTYATSTEFLVGDTDAEDYLGYKVIAYVKNVDGKFEIVSIAKDSNSNDELVIDLDSYAGAGSGANTIAYYKDGDNDKTDIKCDSDIKVVYNNGYLGVATSSITGFLTAPVLYGGTIRFIDNDEEKGYDVAFIEAAATAVVKKVTEDGVTFKKGITLPNTDVMSMLEIDADDETKVVKIYKDGKMIEASELAEWDVLSVIAAKENADVIVAEVVSNKVVGAIQSRKNSKTSATNYAYKVEGNWYDVATNAYEATDSNLEVGIGGAFYIDKYGKIAAFDEDAALDNTVAANYGYINQVKTEEARRAEGYEVGVQILTADGVEYLILKNKAKINLTAGLEANAGGSTPHALADTDPTDDEITVNASKWTSANYSANNTSLENSLKGKVVKYTKNSAGELAEITMANHDNKGKFDVKTGFTIGELGNPATGIEFDADNSRFIGLPELAADTKVFIIGGAGTTTSFKDSKIGTLADLDDKNKYVLMGGYSKDDEVNVIVVDAACNIANTTSSLAVLTEVGDGVNDEEEEIKILSYYIDGELVEGVATVATTELAGASALSQGDIVKVKVGSDGVISNIKMVFDFGSTIRADYNDDAATNYTNAITQDKKDLSEVFAGGVVLGYSDNSTLAKISTIYSGAAVTEEYKLSRAANVYVIDDTGLNTVIKVGSDANFKYFEKLYGTSDVQVWNGNNYVQGTGLGSMASIDTNGDGTDENVKLHTPAEAQRYADHVYLRAYEGKVTDVVIVKTEKELKIK